jgi:hypothetical protein
VKLSEVIKGTPADIDVTVTPDPSIPASLPTCPPATDGPSYLEVTRNGFHLDGTYMADATEMAVRRASWHYHATEASFMHIPSDSFELLVLSGRLRLDTTLAVSDYAHQWDGLTIQELYEQQAKIKSGGGTPGQV